MGERQGFRRSTRCFCVALRFRCLGSWRGRERERLPSTAAWWRCWKCQERRFRWLAYRANSGGGAGGGGAGDGDGSCSSNAISGQGAGFLAAATTCNGGGGGGGGASCSRRGNNLIRGRGWDRGVLFVAVIQCSAGHGLTRAADRLRSPRVPSVSALLVRILFIERRPLLARCLNDQRTGPGPGQGRGQGRGRREHCEGRLGGNGLLRGQELQSGSFPILLLLQSSLRVRPVPSSSIPFHLISSHPLCGSAETARVSWSCKRCGTVRRGAQSDPIRSAVGGD
jgi:hypothetical protein